MNTPHSDADQSSDETKSVAADQPDESQKASNWWAYDYKKYLSKEYLKSRSRGWWIIAFFLFLILLILFWRLFAVGGPTRRVVKPVLVVVAPAKVANVPVYIPALGSVAPTFTVTVRTQVNGRLLRVLYREGQDVKAGDLLAEVDPRPFQAQLIQFQGDLKRDQALLDNARLDLKRFFELYPVGAVSQQTLDTQIALVKQDEGAVQVDQGLIDGTQVNLIYSRITSPINGRVGLRLVDPGNFVQTSDTTGIVVVNTINPITVIFPIPEDNVPAVLQQMHKGRVLTAEAYDRWQHTLLSVGKLITIDNQIDPTTGTVKLKALFPNKDDKLFPEQFVNVQLLVNTQRNAMIVPTAAIQHGANFNFVYRLNKNFTVSVQRVTTSVTWGDYTVVTGVLPGQQVVVEGADKLIDGAKVKVYQNPKASPAPASKPVAKVIQPSFKSVIQKQAGEQNTKLMANSTIAPLPQKLLPQKITVAEESNVLLRASIDDEERRDGEA